MPRTADANQGRKARPTGALPDGHSDLRCRYEKARAELRAVKSQLRRANAERESGRAEQARLSLDMEYLLTATEIGAIFLDKHMNIRRFTPAATRTFDLVDEDIGRPIRETAFRFADTDFLALLAEVNRDAGVREAEVTVGGHAYLIRILPYRARGGEKGAVVAIADIAAQRRVRELDRRNQAVLAALSESIYSWDAKSEIVLFCNDVFAQTTDRRVADVIGRPLSEVIDAEKYRRTQIAMSELDSLPISEQTIKIATPSGAVIWRSVCYTRIDDEHGQPVGYLGCGRDISEQVRYAATLAELTGLDAPIDEPFEASARAALRIGANFLGVDNAMLFEVAGEQRRVLCRISGDDVALDEGALFRLPHRLCALQCSSEKAGLCIFHQEPGEAPRAPAGFSRGRRSSQCEFARGVEQGGAGPLTNILLKTADAGARLHNYIGAQVRMSGAALATLGFFSIRPPRFGAFTDLQRGFVSHIAQWLALKWEIHRERKALLRSEAELRLIFDNVSQNIWRLDGERRVRRANAGAAHAMGRSAADVIGVSADDFLNRLDPNWRAQSRAALANRTARYGVEARSIASDGGVQWTSTDFFPNPGGRNKEKSLLVVSSDITSLKQRETELEIAIAEVDHGRRRFEALYRRTPVLMCSFLADGRLIEASDLWLGKTGYARDEVIGRKLGAFMDEASQARASETVLPQLWRTGACDAVALRFLAKSGQAIDVELSGYLSAQDDNTFSCLAVLVDVTARNAAELALERANRELAAANDGLKKFAHIASHDLQEPLRKIKQFGDLLTTEFRDKLDGDAIFYLDVMRDSSDRMRRLIKDILNFSRSMNATFSRTRLDLVEIAQEVLAELDVAIRESLAVVSFGELPVLWGDRTAAQLLMRNLISNSLKYRRSHVAPLIAVTGDWSAEGDFLMRFKDNGCGIDARYIGTIFDPFTRLHTRAEIDGSGIGLAICKSVCERQNWRISVESRVNEGAEFIVAIPAADVVAPPAPEADHV